MIADRKHTIRTLQTHFAMLLVLLVVAVAPVEASTVVYQLALETGTGGFGVRMEFDDKVQGAIRGAVTLTPGRNTGDIVAVYIDLHSSLALPPLPPLTEIRDAIEGVHITTRAVNTSNVQGGNVGDMYSIGLAIGKDGIGNGKSDIQALSFLMKTPGLMLQHLGAVAVRVTSVGPALGGREESAKFADDYRQYIPDDTSGVPEPGSWLTAGLGLAAIAWYRRRSRPAK